MAGLDRFELHPGDAIEVLWKITRSSDGEDVIETKWWGARLAAGPSDAGSDPEGPPQWKLMYEKFEEFEAEERVVTFVGAHELIDATSDEEMAWRKMGEEWEQEDVDDDEAEQTYTAAELATMVDADVRDASGGASEAEMMQTLQGAVAPERLLQGASAVRDFIDKFKAHLHSVAGADSKENGVVVTKEMVDEFTRSLKQG